MKELDVLLTRFAQERYQGASPVQQRAFEALLTLPDPEIADFLLGYRIPLDPDLAEAVQAVLAKPYLIDSGVTHS